MFLVDLTEAASHQVRLAIPIQCTTPVLLLWLAPVPDVVSMTLHFSKVVTLMISCHRWSPLKVDERTLKANRGRCIASVRLFFGWLFVVIVADTDGTGSKRVLNPKALESWLIRQKRVLCKKNDDVLYSRLRRLPVASGFKCHKSETTGAECSDSRRNLASMCVSLLTEWKKCNLRLWYGVENTSTKSVPSRRSHVALSRMRSSGWFLRCSGQSSCKFNRDIKYLVLVMQN